MAIRNYGAEFSGTFFPVLTIGCTVLPGASKLEFAAGVIPPLAIGTVLIGMIYVGGTFPGLPTTRR